MDIVFAPGKTPTADGSPDDWPALVLVDLPGYEGPAYFADRPTVVPISPLRRHDGGRWREMFPLKLGWALTFHKAQVFDPPPPRGALVRRVSCRSVGVLVSVVGIPGSPNLPVAACVRSCSWWALLIRHAWVFLLPS